MTRMGWLERWDQKNQRTLEYHNDTYQGFDISLGRYVALCVAIQVAIRILDRLIGGGWAVIVLSVVSAIAFVVVFVHSRLRRRAWEAMRAERDRSAATGARAA
jgi:Flp pilus assembly protein TadB